MSGVESTLEINSVSMQRIVYHHINGFASDRDEFVSDSVKLKIHQAVQQAVRACIDECATLIESPCRCECPGCLTFVAEHDIFWYTAVRPSIRMIRDPKNDPKIIFS
jgi:uncharacterized protein (UPF0276 family)